MSDQLGEDDHYQGHDHDTGPGPPYDEEAQQGEEYTYEAAYTDNDGSVVPSVSAPDASADQQQQPYGYELAVSPHAAQSQVGFDTSAGAAGPAEPAYEGQFQVEAMPEDFSWLLHADNKYYCDVGDCTSAGKPFDIPTTIRGAEQKYVRRHVMNHHKGWAERNIPDAADTPEEFTCDICGDSFKRPDYVHKHKRTQHRE
ncbi:hypothetical protein GGTG_11831 [Gaeumannomyces tritici R3-111a-1]|uniref:C2H2-type domain-containing protein n=1 Tax=Gaeumannomyces tritici (strain R3-111a-1) TaxID=644352 RepID=J3PEA8_GAET3|nr:hypothetical protein GGTG_11831 [Gaeumannomyces tritici R3-111a-1]EJT70808.1 hypothetical protein GGTG_11831 [Gaeumannomyces tritici R3-111a-1]